MRINKIGKAASAVALTAGLGLASSAAMAVPYSDFQVDPTAYHAGPQAAVFTADKITGGYTEVITLNGDGTFDISLKWEAGQFFQNDGSDGVPGMISGLGNSYLMYAFYQGSGTYSVSGGVATFTTAAGSGSLEVWLDPQGDSYGTYVQPGDGSTAWTVGGAPDILLATGTPQGGGGVLDPTLPTCGPDGVNCGSFGTTVSFELTTAGKGFFIDPVPFYNLSLQSGQFMNFALAGTQVINGSMDAVFRTVPEPGTLALLGMAFVGLGASVRRRNR